MKKAKNLHKKLIVMLLSMAMVFTSIPQSMLVYAAEADAVLSEAEEPGMNGSDDAVTNENGSDNKESDENVSDGGTSEGVASGSEGASGDNGTDTSGSGNEGTGDSGSGNEGAGDNGTENGGTDNSGSENDGTGDNGSENEGTGEGGSEGEGTEEDGSEDEGLGDAESSEDVTDGEAEEEDSLEKDIKAKASNVRVSDFASVGGWTERMYAEIAGVSPSDVTEVSWTGPTSGSFNAEDLKYLVRKEGSRVRIDILGLKEGTYTLTVKAGASTLNKSGITVYDYDRSGFAHFKYSDGVGAYNDDGTLKAKAKVLYVTEENKNDVELTCGNITVKGIGNILNSVGQDTGGGTTDKGGKPNTNQGIIKALADAGTPLVVRFIGTVSDSGLYEKGTFNAASECEIKGLTAYNSLDQGGSVGDNGHMARIKSGKDITLEGVGYNATIDGWGFHFMAESSAPSFGKSFEVRNLIFINTPEDAIGMEGVQASKNTSSDLTASVERCWVHNNEFYCPNITSPAESDKGEGDGSVDFKRGQYFTCSYNYFDSCHKTNLVGSADYSLQYNLTYHHNYWYMCKARGPLTRNANVHMYNNVVEMQTDYAQNTRANAYIFSEYNLFYACKSPQAVESGAIKSYKDSISSVIWNKGSAGTVVENKSDYVQNSCQFSARKIEYDRFDTNPEQSYIPSGNYRLNTDFNQLRRTVVARGGVQKQYPKLAKDVTVSEYSVIPSNATVHQIDVSGGVQTLNPGKISKSVYAFEVNAPFSLEVKYASGKTTGVLVNEAGENLLTGDGNCLNLESGRYMIQCDNFQPGDSKKGTIAVFKDVTIESVVIVPISTGDDSYHFHKWTLDSDASKAANCTEEGTKVYKCTGEGDCTENNGKRTEIIPALGHSYSAWKVTTPATETTAGEEERTCSRCGDKQTQVIPAGGSGSGSGSGSGGGGTAAGDYVITFDRTVAGDTDFFKTAGLTFKTNKDAPCIEMKTATEITFTCNDGATLNMTFTNTDAGKKIILKYGTESQTCEVGSDGTLTVENLKAGTYTITKSGSNGGSVFVVSVGVSNQASSEVYYKLSFEYNYDDAPEAKEIQVPEGSAYATMSELAPSAFARSGYILQGFYTDADCTKPVEYPYEVNADAVLYANWTEDDNSVVTVYSLIFNTNGGSTVASVRIASNQIYEITQKPTRNGYAFAGWYDASEGGRLVERIDGSLLTGNYTIYAHWNVAEKVTLNLDCAVLKEGNITEKTNLDNSGFWAYALPGGVGETGKESPKYYMTVSSKRTLGTNGVLLTDKNIPGNEEGLLKSIEFTTEGAGILSVEMALSGTPDKNGSYNLVLARRKADGSMEEISVSAITGGTTKTTKEYDVPEAGTYYLYAKGDKGVVYYSMKFTEQAYTVMYKVGNGTAPEGLMSGGVVKAGAALEIGDCTPAPGYTFKGWSVDGEDTIFKDSYTVKAEDASDGVITIKAVYEAKQYTLKYDAGDGTLAGGTQETSTVSTGDRITLGSCTAPTGKTFIGWSMGDSADLIVSPYVVNAADADANGTITFKAVYKAEGDETVYCKVILDTDGGTLVEGGGRDRQVPADTQFDPGACEKTGYKFVGWTVNGAVVKMPYTVITDITFKAKYTTEGGPSGGDDDNNKHEGIAIIGLEKTYEYTGAKVIPNIGVVDYDIGDGKVLRPNVDYTVKYKNNVKLGDATITVTGKGNYAGKDAEQKFKIVAAENAPENTELLNLKGAKLDKIDSEEYTGEAKYPTFTLTLKDRTSKKYTYDPDTGVYKNDGTPINANVAVSNNINKGTATIYITGANDAKGNATKVKKTFKITAIDLAKNASKVKVEAADGTYSVNGAEPGSITVTYDGKTLINGTDYTVKYSNNKKATTSASANITITGKGNYAKKYTQKKYKINQLDMSELQVSAVTAYKDMKAGKVKATVVDKNGNILKPAQYTLAVYKNAGGTEEWKPADKLTGESIYVKAKAKDTVNLKGETSIAEFNVGVNIAKAKVVLRKVGKKPLTMAYTGEEVKLDGKNDLTVTIKGENGKLQEGTDYVIAEYSNNINKGTATAVIKGIGKYSGTKTVKFKIVGKSIDIKGEADWKDIPDNIKSFMKNWLG